MIYKYILYYFLFIFTLINISQSCLLEGEKNAVYTSVYEDLEPKSVLVHLPLQSSSPDIQLKLIKGEEYVSLDTKERNLILEKSLDRETGSHKFEVVVECRNPTDKFFPHVNISTFINVKDINDNAPEFEQNEYKINVTEELPKGTIVFMDFEANDIDQEGDNSLVRYKIMPGEHSKYLEIQDPYKPIITVNERIDYEKITEFEVEIEARDGGEPSLSSIAKLFVTVLDTDDQNPVFTHEYYYTNSISDSIFEVFPSPIFAKDGDTLNEPIFYELSGDNHEEFFINSNGSIKLLSEEVPSTIIFVHAKQINKPERESVAILRIANQTSIEFQHYLYSVQISAKAPIGMELLQVKATTSNQNNEITYSIVDDSSNLISIDEKTGKIELISNPSKSNYNIKLMASDGKARTWSQFHITVTNLNNYEPEFEKKNYKFDIKDSALLGQVRAIDRDSNDSLEYRLLNLNTLFRIDQEGMLSVKSMMALSPNTIYEVIALAEDTQGHKTFTNVKISSKAGISSGFKTAASILAFVVLIVTIAIMIFFVLKKIKKIWFTNKRAQCWMSSGSDQGVIITDSFESTGKSEASTIRATNHRTLYETPSPVPKITNTDNITLQKPIAPSPPSMSTFSSSQLSTIIQQTASPGNTSCGNAQLVPVTIKGDKGTGTPTIYF
uniref:Cadherin n=1 Tax=Parastrongyloides trichosuri TaxID=131310 RepID=A0A0N4Z947_PARTI